MKQKTTEKSVIKVFFKIKKLPFLNWFLISGVDVKKLQDSRAIQARILAKHFDKIMDLKKKLKRYED
jgi:hypothetical protein